MAITAVGKNTHEMLTGAVVGQRWAQVLRRRYGSGSVSKRVAAELDVDPRTVEGWMQGRPPHLAVVLRAVLIWQDASLFYDLAGLSAPDPQILSDRLRNLEKIIAEIGQQVAP